MITAASSLRSKSETKRDKFIRIQIIRTILSTYFFKYPDFYNINLSRLPLPMIDATPIKWIDCMGLFPSFIVKTTESNSFFLPAI